MYLAGSFILLLSALTLVGMLLSDLLLALLDPRIRFD
jgi:peptide/nickel transport system permease protein